jgi:hypothetical protein
MKCQPDFRLLFALVSILGTPFLGTAQESVESKALDKAEVRIPYLDLRTLWENATEAMEAKPPPGALLSALFQADLTGGKVALEAEFRVENFSGKWEHIPLMDAGPTVASVQPAETRLVIEKDKLCVITKDSGALTIKVRFADAAIRAGNEKPFLELCTTPAAVTSLAVKGLPEGKVVRTKENFLVPDATGSVFLPLPAKGGELSLMLANALLVPKEESSPRLETAVAIVTKSEYTTRLVGDGSTLTEASLELEHDDALRWSFTLPEKCDLLKCAVDGKPMRPIARENGIMEIPLEHGGDSKTTARKVTFSYTCAKGKLHAVEGETTLELPLTPLFIQELNWAIEVPEAYEVTGVDGNVEFAASAEAKTNTVRLVKRLCRNERPQAHLFYRKRGLE